MILVLSVINLNKNIFFYLKLLFLSKLIISKYKLFFLPLKEKNFIWNCRFYQVIKYIKVNVLFLIIILSTGNLWYKSVSKILNYLKYDYYTISNKSYFNILINKIGFNIENLNKKYLVCPIIGQTKTCILNIKKNLKLYYIYFYKLNKIYSLCKYKFLNNSNFRTILNYSITYLFLYKNVKIFNKLRYDGNFTKKLIRFIVYFLLKGGEVLWDIGSSCGFISIIWTVKNKGICFNYEIKTEKFKFLFFNFLKKNIKFNKFNIILNRYFENLFGNNIPDRIFFGCGIRSLIKFRYSYLQLKFNGIIIIISVTNLSNVIISYLNFYLNCKTYLINIYKIKLKINSKIYKIYSSVTILKLKKNINNEW